MMTAGTNNHFAKLTIAIKAFAFLAIMTIFSSLSMAEGIGGHSVVDSSEVKSEVMTGISTQDLPATKLPAAGMLNPFTDNVSKDLNMLAEVDSIRRVIDVSINTKEAGSWDVQLVDKRDKVISARRVFSSGETTKGQFTIRRLPKGAYKVVVTNGNEIVTRTLKI